MDGVKTVNYSNVFMSCFCDNAKKCIPAAREHFLAYIYSGELVITENEERTKIRGGECVFIRKDNSISMTKQPKNGEQFKSIFLCFTRPFLREFYYKSLDKSKLPTDAQRHKVSLYKIPADRPDVRSLFESMTPYFDSPIPPDNELLKLKMMEGLLILLNTNKDVYASLFDFAEPWKIDILDYLNTNYMYNISVKDIALYTGRSLASLQRDFKKISSLTPERWLVNKRLEVAHNKICNDGKKISDVYFEVGFKNLSHFSRAFKKRFGYSPREYKKSELHSKED
jgi:AraC-like DNA-binding protein